MAVQRRGAAIDIAGLRKEYLSGPGRVLALDDINLRDRAGRVRLHRRSVRLRQIDAAAHPRRPRPQTGGSIKVDAPGWAVENAMVFQDSGLFPWMSVEANVGFGLMTRGVPARRGGARGSRRR